MNNYTVLEERFEFESGLKYLHVMAVDAPVDVDAVLRDLVPGQSRDWYLDIDSSEGKKIVRHHLELYYPYRDTIRVRPVEWNGDESILVNGVFWRRTGRERMSAIIQDAADAYWGHYDVAPGIALVPNQSKNIPDRMTLGGCCEAVSIPVRAVPWMPNACVIVCGYPAWMSNGGDQ